jgi:hypothetical protein
VTPGGHPRAVVHAAGQSRSPSGIGCSLKQTACAGNLAHPCCRSCPGQRAYTASGSGAAHDPHGRRSQTSRRTAIGCTDPSPHTTCDSKIETQGATYVMPLALRWRRQLAALPLGFSQASEDGATTRSTGAYDALTKTHTRSTRSGFRVLTTHPPLPFFARARCTCATGVVHEYTRGGFVRGRKISLRVDLWSLPPYIESQNHSTYTAISKSRPSPGGWRRGKCYYKLFILLSLRCREHAAAEQPARSSAQSS